jgi:hypothetical protein
MAVSAIQKLKFYFDKLNEEFGEPLNLNKSDSKFNYYNSKRSKGVESDFIRIYKLGLIIGKKVSENVQYSFAFSFVNPEDSEKSLITITLKEGEEIKTGSTYNSEQMKERLKELIKTINVLNENDIKNVSNLKKSIFDIFEFNKQNINDQKIIKEAKKQIEIKTKESIIEETQLKEKYNLYHSEMLKSQEKYNNFRRNKIKELGIDELEKKLKLLNEKLKEDSKIERKFLKLDEIEKNTNDTKSKLNKTVEKNKKTVQSVLEKYPSHIKKQVISELDKEKNLEKNKNKLPVEDNSLSM